MAIYKIMKRGKIVQRSSYFVEWAVCFEDWSTGPKLTNKSGQGKTQLALEYCRKKRPSHSVFWVDATNSGTAFRSFENIGSKLAPGANFPNPEAARSSTIEYAQF